ERGGESPRLERPRAPWVANVLITYGIGHHAATDHTLPCAGVALALRILFFAFKQYMPDCCMMFQGFVEIIMQRFRGTNAWTALTAKHVLNTIAEVMNTKYG